MYKPIADFRKEYEIKASKSIGQQRKMMGQRPDLFWGEALHGWVKIFKYINTQEEVTKF